MPNLGSSSGEESYGDHPVTGPVTEQSVGLAGCEGKPERNIQKRYGLFTRISILYLQCRVFHWTHQNRFWIRQNAKWECFVVNSVPAQQCTLEFRSDSFSFSIIFVLRTGPGQWRQDIQFLGQADMPIYHMLKRYRYLVSLLFMTSKSLHGDTIC